MLHNRQLFIHPSPSQPSGFVPIGGPARSPILAAPRRAYSLSEAYALCEKLAHARHDGIPAASRFVPALKRPHLAAIYAFARAASSFADDPQHQGQRHSALDQWEDELIRTFHGEADHPLFVALRDTIERCDLPVTPFQDLIAGCRMDLAPSLFATFDELRTYCRLRAEPIGQLVLGVFGYREPSLLGFAGELCTALSLTVFMQDLGRDLPRGRLLLPVEDLRHFGVLPEGVRTAPASAHLLGASSRAWRDLLRFQVARARALLERGRPLIDRVGEDLRFELLLTYGAGAAMLSKIEALADGVLRERPTLSKAEQARVLARAAAHTLPKLALVRGGDLLP